MFFGNHQLNHQFIIYLVHSLFICSFYYSLTYFLFSTYIFIFCISAIQIEQFHAVCGVGKHCTIILKHFKKLNTFFCFSIDPPYLSSEQPVQIQRRCFVHYLVIPEVSRRMDTSICHLVVFYRKVVDTFFVSHMLLPVYMSFSCFKSSLDNKKANI